MKLTAFATATLFALSLAAHAQTSAPAAKAPTTAPAAALPVQPPDVPAIKVGPDGKPNASFMAAHDRFVKIAQAGDVDLLFLGDSITAGWGRQRAIWEKSFGPYKPANFGIGGDRTQHVLWRILNGELDGAIKPKGVVLMIGTNNSATDSAEGIAKGVTLIVETIRAKQPQAKILLLAVFPRGEKAEANDRRVKLKEVNAIIAKLDDGKNVHYLDIGDKFLQADGTLTKEIMPDFLHLSAAGYQIWADAITPKLTELMK
ncbi:lysophospholipase L1-like esterase [Prosthecobacter fusiformis]|uniref:Lysophospholipase L1-like esterase n=1 Tax=Prosthecobacter fusiformis TaxID=48464 RepID=A0A4R7S5W0_9BACT|nr:platelet-activating factor acetylhydrolase IB subunit [Prosthecobacter fusiformis]TDU72785.1 lysophospholipase L1-like esterase [Prosthecobacter fusiformis]